MCVMVDTFMDLRRQFWEGYFLLPTLLGQGLPCVFCSAARWPVFPSLLFPPASHGRVLGLQTYGIWLFFFLWAVGFDVRWSTYHFYLQSHPQSLAICFWLFACRGYYSFSVALSLSRKRREFPFRRKKGKLIDGEMRQSLPVEVRTRVLLLAELGLKVESHLLRTIGWCRSLNWSHNVLDN